VALASFVGPVFWNALDFVEATFLRCVVSRVNRRSDKGADVTALELMRREFAVSKSHIQPVMRKER
jgi:hypothetical protein